VPSQHRRWNNNIAAVRVWLIIIITIIVIRNTTYYNGRISWRERVNNCSYGESGDSNIKLKPAVSVPTAIAIVVPVSSAPAMPPFAAYNASMRLCECI